MKEGTREEEEDIAYEIRCKCCPKIGGVWQLFFFCARLLDHEETWKYTNGSGWC